MENVTTPGHLSTTTGRGRQEPLRATEFAPGHAYHLYNRGVGRQLTFRGEENTLFLLGLMKKTAREHQVAVIAYCLMPNHYLLLVRQDGEDAAGLLPQLAFNS